MKTSSSTPRTSRKTPTAALNTPDTVKKARAPRATTTRRKVATPAGATAESAPQLAPTIEDLNRRAYEIYLGRNGHGDALSDWLQAEQELMAR